MKCLQATLNAVGFTKLDKWMSEQAPVVQYIENLQVWIIWLVFNIGVKQYSTKSIDKLLNHLSFIFPSKILTVRNNLSFIWHSILQQITT